MQSLCLSQICAIECVVSLGTSVLVLVVMPQFDVLTNLFISGGDTLSDLDGFRDFVFVISSILRIIVIGILCSSLPLVWGGGLHKNWTEQSMGASKVHRIERTSQLFVRRLYESAFIDLSLLLNTKMKVARAKNQERLDRYRGDPKEEHKDCFDFECHIYVDDAFMTEKHTEKRVVNSYVNDLIHVVIEIMYLYYLLGWKGYIVKNPQKIPRQNNLCRASLISIDGESFLMPQYDNDNKRKFIADDNTYILALDGDTDFQPKAVILLIDRLRMYDNVGAACGRIHPTGMGAFQFVFSMTGTLSIIVASIPPVFYIIVCFVAKANAQITIAAIMSVLYAFLMTASFFSIIGDMVLQGTFLTPTGLFLVSMAIMYLVTAILHPEEFGMIIYGLMYFICIPSGYLLLTIYSLVNMHIVTWGTRESNK
ncbi:Hypothetical protein SMAX5B_012609 [Scophthalmus maximus]|uniref:Chitin synthase n=1 Tax=Scophthalmus maximus TaxID=52904 RepID=A0A2U9BCK5_SCOMX|nr:Hypothetical protein SMAX5B_012609 [Scophthalmus maximus]